MLGTDRGGAYTLPLPNKSIERENRMDSKTVHVTIRLTDDDDYLNNKKEVEFSVTMPKYYPPEEVLVVVNRLVGGLPEDYLALPDEVQEEEPEA